VREDDQPIGYLILTLGYSVEYGGRDGFIDELYLVPAARGRGVGGKLLEFVLASAAALAIRTLHWKSKLGTNPQRVSIGRQDSRRPVAASCEFICARNPRQTNKTTICHVRHLDHCEHACSGIVTLTRLLRYTDSSARVVVNNINDVADPDFPAKEPLLGRCDNAWRHVGDELASMKARAAGGSLC